MHLVTNRADCGRGVVVIGRTDNNSIDFAFLDMDQFSVVVVKSCIGETLLGPLQIVVVYVADGNYFLVGNRADIGVGLVCCADAGELKFFIRRQRRPSGYATQNTNCQAGTTCRQSFEDVPP